MRPKVAPLVVIAVGAVALSGCSGGSGGSASANASATNGIASLDGRTILDQAYQNAKAQASVTVSGNGHCQSDAFVVNMHLAKSGQATGDVTFGNDKLTVLASNDSLYIKAPSTFWAANSASPSAAAKVGDKWVVSTNANDSVCVRALTSFSALLANFLDLQSKVKGVTAGSVLGKPAAVVQLPEATVFVSEVGTPLPVRVDSTAPQEDGGLQDGMSFGEWNKPVAVTIPSAEQTVDASVLTVKS